LYRDRLAPFFVILAASLWAVDGIVLRPVLYNLSVTLVVFVESVIVALLLTPIMLGHLGKLKSLTYRDWLAFFGVALLAKALFYVNYVNLSIVILIQKLQPVFALTLAGILLKEKLTKGFFIWAGFAIIGAYIMTFGLNLPELKAGDKTVLAAIFALIAAISFSSSTVLSKRALRNVGFELGTYLRFTFSTIIMLVIVVTSGTITEISEISSNQFLIFLLIAFTTGGAAIFIYYYGLKKITASVAAVCELAFPLTAVILEYFLRGNIMGPVQWAGAFLLLFSILRVTKLPSLMPKTKN